MHHPIIPPRPLVAKITGFGRAGATFGAEVVVDEVVVAAVAVDMVALLLEKGFRDGDTVVELEERKKEKVCGCWLSMTNDDCVSKYHTRHYLPIIYLHTTLFTTSPRGGPFFSDKI